MVDTTWLEGVRLGRDSDTDESTCPEHLEDWCALALWDDEWRADDVGPQYANARHEREAPEGPNQS